MNTFEHIQLVALDVDGVLTDGTILVLENGLHARRMSIRDGYALQLAVKQGLKIVIISGAVSEPVRERLNKLGIVDVFMDVKDKKALMVELAAQWQVPLEQVLFMGDDIPDREVMQWVGVAACPADAVPEIQEIAAFQSSRKGGEGCVRDILENILKAQNKWVVDSSVPSR